MWCNARSGCEAVFTYVTVQRGCGVGKYGVKHPAYQLTRTIQRMTSVDDAYRKLVEGIADYAIFWLDPDGVIGSWNTGAVQATQHAPVDAVGQPFDVLFSDEASGTARRLLDEARSAGRAEEDGWCTRRDGTRFWAQTVVEAVRDAGALSGFAVVMRDRTERKRVDEELRRHQELFRVLVQGVADYAIFMLDPEGYVSSWNSGAERIKGYQPDDIIGRHYSAFYTPEDAAAGEPQRNLQAALAEGRVEREGWRVRKDGSRFWAHVIIDRITSAQGELVGFAKVTRDVTEQRAAQKALEETREALFQSQKLEAIGQLTGGVAHDFNNLLMAVEGNLELMEARGPLNERMQTLVRNALTGVRRGVSLTQRMLAFARRQALHLEPVDVHRLVEDMLPLLRTALGPAVVIEVRVPAGVPPVQGDVNQLELCILNLCVNARDAMAEGGTITIEAARDSAAGVADLKPGRYVRLSVRDTGVGMDAETLARAAEPFFTTKGVGKGTGLGLSMVHGIARQCGGALVLQSSRPGGTTASIVLPISAARATTDTPALDATAPAPEAPEKRRPVVLVVDDDPLVLSTTVEMLSYAGYDAHPATSAREALAAAEVLPHMSVVVTDHAMPGMTGSELARVLVESRPGLRVVLASGYAEVADHTPAVAARLQKPYGRDALLRAVEG